MQTVLDGASVGKAQKSLLINEDLVRLLEAHQKRTGASFTKQVTAAVLQYLFEHPRGPDPYWMEHAVALDAGETNLGEILEDRRECAELEDGQLLDFANEAANLVAKDAPPVTARAAAFDFGISEHARLLASNTLHFWERMLERDEDDPIQKIVAHWSAHASFRPLTPAEQHRSAPRGTSKTDPDTKKK